MGAVGPEATTVRPVPAAVALFRYVPAVDETLTRKCSVIEPGVEVAAGTVNVPDHVSVEPLIVGFAVVAPVVEPAVYVNPAGSVSVIELSVAGTAPGLL